jgi:hypothetical protein
MYVYLSSALPKPYIRGKRENERFFQGPSLAEFISKKRES